MEEHYGRQRNKVDGGVCADRNCCVGTVTEREGVSTGAVVFFIRRKATHCETGETSLGPFVILDDAQALQRQYENALRDPKYEYEYSIEEVPTAFPLR